MRADWIVPADLELAALKPAKDCLINSSVVYQSDALSFRKLLRHCGLHGRWHELDHFNAGFLQLEPQRLYSSSYSFDHAVLHAA